MRILVLDAALSRCLAALVEDGRVLRAHTAEGFHGQAAALPPLVAAVLDGKLDAVAVCVGPGSFTGLRAAIALAEGLGAARDIPVVPVTTGEALAAGLPSDQAVWAVTENRRGQFFVERFGAGGQAAGAPLMLAEADLPRPEGLVWLVGDGSAVVAARMAAPGWPVALGRARRIEPLALALAARRRLEGSLAPRPLEPLYAGAPATT